MSNPALEFVLRELAIIPIEYIKMRAKIEKKLKEIEEEQISFFKAAKKYQKTGDLSLLKAPSKSSQLKAGHNCDVTDATSTNSSQSSSASALSEATQDNIPVVNIKKEKVSLDSQVGKENISLKDEDMPAPSWIPPLKKKVKTERPSRSTRTKGKSVVRDSDVVLQPTPVPIIDLDNEDEGSVMARSTRSTRTKAKKEAEDAALSDAEAETSRIKTDKQSDVESDEVPTRSTRTKTLRKGKKQEKTEEETKPETEKEVRSTRTKTIRKGTPPTDNTSPEETNKTIQAETRSTRTKTTRKIKDEQPTSSEEVTNSMPALPSQVASERETRGTRTKTIRKAKDVQQMAEQHPQGPEANETQVKRNRSFTDEGDSKHKKSRSHSPPSKADTTSQTVYEDAESNLDSTYVAAKPTKNAHVDGAVVTEPAGTKKEETKNVFNIFNTTDQNLLTDDESIEAKTPPKPAKKVAASKEVFSPYEKTNLKKKVEAFEKLHCGSEIPVKTASYKSNTGTAVKEKAKLFTPLANKFAPSTASTSKFCRNMGVMNKTGDGDNNGSKSVQKEARDLMRRQQEREMAIKKKEAKLQELSEKKRTLNEMKQLKAQQQREEMDAKRRKLLEQQLLKDEERRKQIEREREEERLKYKKAQEKKYEARKMRYNNATEKPIYMTEPLPPLPLVPEGDISLVEQKTEYLPKWTQEPYLRQKQLCMLAAGQKIKNTLFCRRPQTVNLLEIFEVIDPRKLKRNSSAIWKEPPRFSMMPDLEKTYFSGDSNGDDDVFEA